MSYFDTLYEASFRGFPFVVEASDGEFGRKTVTHNYPFRDTVWVEDLGREPGRHSVHGFLVGDDVIFQRDALRRLCELAGPGILIHPSYGILSVVLEGKLHCSERKENGRQIEISFDFVESTGKLFPSIDISTFGDVLDSASKAFDAFDGDFLDGVGTVIKQGASVIQTGVQTVSEFSAIAGAGVKEATNLFHLSSALPGVFGRYFGGKTGVGGNSISGTISSVTQVSNQVSQLIGQGAAARANVGSAIDFMIEKAGAL